MIINFNLKVLIGKNTPTDVQCTSTAVNVKIATIKETGQEVSDIDLQRFIENVVLQAIKTKMKSNH